MGSIGRESESIIRAGVGICPTKSNLGVVMDKDNVEYIAIIVLP